MAKTSKQDRYHFIGIGGIGMGTLASLMLAKGYRVSGSDLSMNDLTKGLKARGATIFQGHDLRNIEGADYIVYSSAIRVTNPEMIEGVSRQIPMLKRAEMLSKLLNQEAGIAVAGAHGKTTTSSMISHMMISGGLKPTTAIGGIIHEGVSYHAELGEGKYFVAEVDESDGSFLYFTPQYAIVTNIDVEHLDYYKSWANIQQAYKKFMGKIKPGGILIYCGDDKHLADIFKQYNGRVKTYGLQAGRDIWAKNIVTDAFSTRFSCVSGKKILGDVVLNVPGRHNVSNALAAITLGLDIGMEFQAIASSLEQFRGVKRRFQKKGLVRDILVIDDYGHHPTEIIETLKTAKAVRPGRLVVVFQPHRYSRTKFLLDEFAACFRHCDQLILTDIYAASEKPGDGVPTETLYYKIKDHETYPCVYIKREELLEKVAPLLNPGDMVLTLGAGDITRLSDELVARLIDIENAAVSKKSKEGSLA